MKRFSLLLLLFVGFALKAWAQPPYFDQGYTPQVVANPPGPWAPCQVVTFTFHIEGFNSFPGVSQWLHGLGIQPGPCWTNLTYGPPPPSYSGGQWVVDQTAFFSNNAQLGGCAGQAAWPGFYIDNSSGYNGGQPQNDPGNNWGDTSTQGPWDFSWSATVPCDMTDPCDLTMGAQVYGDGETGSWGSVPDDSPTTPASMSFTVTNPTTGAPQNVFCVDSIATLLAKVTGACGAQAPFYYMNQAPDQDFTYTWNFDGGSVGAGTDAGPYNVSWSTPGIKTVTCTFTSIATGVQTVITHEVTVYKAYKTKFTVSDSTLCLSQSAVITYTGDADNTANYVWIFGPGATAVQQGAAQIYNVTWNAPGNKSISLNINPNSPCPSTVTTHAVKIIDLLPDFGSSQDKACEGTPFVLNYPHVYDVPLTYQWTFAEGSPESASTAGPHTVTWATVGDKAVSLTVGSDDYCYVSKTDTLSVLPINTSAFMASRSAACSDEAVFFHYTGDAEAQDNATYLWNFGTDALPPMAGGMGPHSVIWSTPGLKSVQLILNQNSICPSQVTTVVIAVNEKPSLQFDIQDSACVGLPVNITYGGAANADFSYHWKFMSNAVPSAGLGVGPHEVSWLTPGVKNITLRIITPGCIRDTAQTITLNSVPVVHAGGGGYICRDSCATLSGNVNLSGCQILWVTEDGSNGYIENPTQLVTKACPQTTTRYVLRAKSGECWSNYDTVTVTVNPSPIAAIAVPEMKICIGNYGSIIPGSGSGGTGELKYYWSPIDGLDNAHSPTPIANPTQNTTYMLTVVDSNGCSSLPVSVDVIVNPKPTADAGPDVYICKGSGAFINATVSGAPGTYIYEWTPAIGLSCADCPNPYVTADVTTVYTVKVKVIETGCESQPLDSVSRITAYIVPRATANAGPDTVKICKGEEIQVGDLPFGAGPLYRYQWTPAVGLYSPESNQPDTLARPFARPEFTTMYFLRVISLGCESSVDSIVVKVKPEPMAVVDKPYITVCRTDSAFLEALVPPIELQNVIYNWSPTTGLSDASSRTPKAHPAEKTTYTLTVTAEDCIGSQTATVTVDYYAVPEVDALTAVSPNQITFCQSDSANGLKINATVNGPDFYEFNWTPNVAIENPTVLQPIVRPLQTTRYRLQVTQPASGCVYYDSVLVVVPPKMTLSVTSDTLRICQGGAARFVATGRDGFSPSYTWTPKTGLSCIKCAETTASPDETTQYIVTAYEAGCYLKDTVRLEVIPAPKADFLYNGPAVCENAPLIAFQNISLNGLAYRWDFGDGIISNEENPTHLYGAPGTYLVTLKAVSPGGYCSDATNAQTVTVGGTLKAAFSSMPAYSDSSAVRMYLPNATVQFMDSSALKPTAWNWSFGDGQGSTLQNPSHVYEKPGVYFVRLIVTNAAGCNDTLSHGPYVVEEPTLSFPNVITPNGDGFNDVFRLQYRGNDPTEVQIYTRWGEVLFTGVDVWEAKTDGGSEVPSGLYFYRVAIGKKIYTGSLTVLRGKNE